MPTDQERAEEYCRQLRAREAWRRAQAKRMAGDPALRKALEEKWEPLRLAVIEAREAFADG